MKKGWVKTAPRRSIRKAYLGDEPMADYPPTLCLDSKNLPEIKDWKVGQTYEVSLKIKQTSMSTSEREGGESRTHADFVIEAIKVL